MFVMFEDEIGVVNIVVWLDMKFCFCKVVMGVWLMEVCGWVEVEEGVVYVIVVELIDVSDWFYVLFDDFLILVMVGIDFVDWLV